MRAKSERRAAIDLDRAYAQVLSALRENQLLLESDAAFPSVASLLAGGPIRGSWWAHPLAHEIYGVCERLADSGESLRVKLVSRKVTHVHRGSWPALYAIASAGEPWQLAGLPDSARALLKRVEARGAARMDEIESRWTRKQLGDDARELEARLLVYGDDVHTASGAHVKRIETWQSAAARLAIDANRAPAASVAREHIERIVAAMNARSSAKASLPWQTGVRRGAVR